MPGRAPYPGYNITAEEQNGVLVPEEQRITRIAQRYRYFWYANGQDADRARNIIKSGRIAYGRDSFHVGAARLIGQVRSRPPGCQRPRRIRGQADVSSRSAEVHAWTLQEAKGTCELCGDEGPFKRASSREPFLEVHHVEPLATGGPDVPENAVALCPNCHRRAHYGNRKKVAKNSGSACGRGAIDLPQPI